MYSESKEGQFLIEPAVQTPLLLYWHSLIIISASLKAHWRVFSSMYPQRETSSRSVDYCVVHSPKIYGHPKTERQINSHDTDGFDLKDFLCILSVCPWVDKLLKDLLNQLNCGSGGRLKIQCCDHCQCAQKSLRPGTKAVFRDLPVGDYWRRRKWSIKKTNWTE